tara:strand:- start:725 stop:1600 length:876 start_codon:yes stop_codon:yes gene_type:complete
MTLSDDSLFTALLHVLAHNTSIDEVVKLKCVSKQWRRVCYSLLADQSFMGDLYIDQGETLICDMLTLLSNARFHLPVQCCVFQFPVHDVDALTVINFEGMPLFTLLEYSARFPASMYNLVGRVSGLYYHKYIINMKLRMDSTGQVFTSIAAAMRASAKAQRESGIDGSEGAVMCYHPVTMSERPRDHLGLDSHVLIVVPSRLKEPLYYHGPALSDLAEETAGHYNKWFVEENKDVTGALSSGAFFRTNVADGKPMRHRDAVLFGKDGTPCVSVGCCLLPRNSKVGTVEEGK